ncbi:hypothetical protein H359_0634 [Chlamydia ibidis 10-1398/6]|uniref:Nef attachable domain protein n=1 Tax=Chlamydia ibidis 10-1398/6 TaxID=1046581 RepID=A0ABN0MYW6_9CHLA|nr:hypothetical protein H359_0634 [Chlamydia ibidis 10-1398/6]
MHYYLPPLSQITPSRGKKDKKIKNVDCLNLVYRALILRTATGKREAHSINGT